MTLHVFNPEHDIALGYNRAHLTVPHAAQELRMNLGWIPALWANDGDAVLVDDVAFAVKASQKYRGRKADVVFVSLDDVRGQGFEAVLPWGWDITLATQLREAGVPERLLPSASNLLNIRNLSNRRITEEALKMFRQGLENVTCGAALYVDSIERGEALLARWPRMVVKAPWSSSGRGVKYVDGELTPSVRGFMNHVVKGQGGLMVEPLYNKVDDFAMEFEAQADGKVVYRGLSLFHTVKGAYSGNLLATEEEKREELMKRVPGSLIDEIRERACGFFSSLLAGRYAGPFGIDMMIVKGAGGDGYLLHPCVEVNLRRTMGHVSLALMPQKRGYRGVMAVVHRQNYHLAIDDIDSYFVKVI